MLKPHCLWDLAMADKQPREFHITENGCNNISLEKVLVLSKGHFANNITIACPTQLKIYPSIAEKHTNSCT